MLPLECCFINQHLYSRTKEYCSERRCSGLTVSAPTSGSCCPGSSPTWGNCVVFLGTTLHNHSASFHHRGVNKLITDLLSHLACTCTHFLNLYSKKQPLLAQTTEGFSRTRLQVNQSHQFLKDPIIVIKGNGCDAQNISSLYVFKSCHL